MEHMILTTAVFGLGFAAMAVGVIVSGRSKELKGSCGGVANNPDCCQKCDKSDDEKKDCDHGSPLSGELAHVAGQRTTDHPSLSQHP